MVLIIVLAVLILAGIAYFFAPQKAEPVRLPVRTNKDKR